MFYVSVVVDGLRAFYGPSERFTFYVTFVLCNVNVSVVVDGLRAGPSERFTLRSSGVTLMFLL